MADFSSKKEKLKLQKVFANLSEDKQKVCAGLVADACFQAEQLEILRDYITKNGWSETYQNGANQWGKKSSVEADAYARVQKLYQTTIKQLTDLLPDSKSEGISKAGETLASFVAKGKSIELR